MPEAMQRKKMIRQALKWLWLLGAFLVLLTSLVAYDGKPNSDADLLLGYAMLALSVPLGLVIAAALSLLGRIAYAVSGYIFTTSYVSITVTWLVFFIAGYLQWFKILPWLWRKWNARRVAAARST